MSELSYPTAEPPRHRLNAIFACLTGEQVQRIAALGVKEWDNLSSALAAETNEAFDAAFGEFVAAIRQRGGNASDSYIESFLDIVGRQSLYALGEIVKRAEQLSYGARESAEILELTLELGRKVARLREVCGRPYLRALPYGTLLEDIGVAVGLSDLNESLREERS